MEQPTNQQLESARALIAAALQNFKQVRGVPDESDDEAFAAYLQKAGADSGDVETRFRALEWRVRHLEAAIAGRDRGGDDTGSVPAGTETPPPPAERAQPIAPAPVGSALVTGRLFSGSELADRLQISVEELRKHVGAKKGDAHNHRWTRERDPESIGWVVRGRDRYAAVPSTALRDDAAGEA